MNQKNSPFDPSDEKFSAYRGMWVALIGDKVVGQGASEAEAKRFAALSRRREKPVLQFIPPLPILNLPDYFFKIQALSNNDTKAYLVGGAVRDMLKGVPIHDLDFVITGNVQSFARKIANALEGAYYCVNKEFDVARVIFYWDGVKQVADFVALQGETIEEDLQQRDFTINAIALDLKEPTYLIDPLHGATHLFAKQLHLCAPSAIANDPIRILRAIRISLKYELRLMPQVIAEIQTHKANLSTDPSKERIRDEFFKFFQLPTFKPAFLLLHHFGIDKILFPHHDFDPQATKQLTQQFHALNQLLHLFQPTENEVNRLQIGMIYTILKPYLADIKEVLHAPISDERCMQDLLYFAHFTSLENLKTDIETFRLSNAEQLILKKLLSSLLLVSQIDVEESPQQHLQIYRFYQNTQPAAFGVLYLAISNMLAQQSYQPNIPEIQSFLEKCRVLLDAWVNHYDEWIEPPFLIDGRLLMRKTGLKPGPKVGEVLESIREAQLLGKISAEKDAIDYAILLLK